MYAKEETEREKKRDERERAEKGYGRREKKGLRKLATMKLLPKRKLILSKRNLD